jgi:hypothetical protein
MNKIIIATLLTSVIGNNVAIAGMPARPYFAWINPYKLENPNVTSNIEQYIKSQPEDEFCGKTALWWIAYVQTRPSGITEDLVQKATELNDKKARATIAKSITQFRDKDVDNGLDGVVAYSIKPESHMVSINAHGKLRKSSTIKDPRDPQQIINAFCAVIPESYRR